MTDSIQALSLREYREELSALDGWLLDTKGNVDWATFREACDHIYRAALRAVSPRARAVPIVLGHGVGTLDAAVSLHGERISNLVRENCKRLPGGREWSRSYRHERSQ